MSTEKKVTLLSVMPEELRAQIKKEVVEEIEQEKEKRDNEVSPAMKQYLENKKSKSNEQNIS